MKIFGNQLNNYSRSQKSYWKILNRLLNKNKIPVIPPLLENNKFVTNFIMKVNIVNEYFVKQCRYLINDCELPRLSLLTDKQLNEITFTIDTDTKVCSEMNWTLFV